MTEYQARITSKGQVTIPVEVRRALGLETGDSIVLELRGDYAVVTRQRSSLEIVRGLADTNRHEAARYATDDEAVEAYFGDDHLAAEDAGDELLSITFTARPTEGR